MKLFVSFGVLGLGVLSQAQTINSGALFTFNTVAGAHLSSPSSYLRAIKFDGLTTNTVVSGITFTPSNNTTNFTPNNTSFAPGFFGPNYGSTPNDFAFASIMANLGHSNGGPAGGTFRNLTPGQYLLKMYFFENFYTSTPSRKFDILIDNTRTMTGLNLAAGSTNTSYVYEVPVTVGVAGLFTASAVSGGYSGFDNVGVISAMTLQSVPEPATMAVLGLGLVGLAKRRRK